MPRVALFATLLAGTKESTSMAEADRRPVHVVSVSTHLVAFIIGLALAIVVLFAGVVTPPI